MYVIVNECNMSKIKMETEDYLLNVHASDKLFTRLGLNLAGLCISLRYF
jgi:hypothetical protein